MSRRSRVPGWRREGRTTRSAPANGTRLVSRAQGRDNAGVPAKPEPAILDVQAGLGEVKRALLTLGATAPEQRSVAFVIGEHLLLLAYDEIDKFTTIAVGGPDAVRTAHGLAHNLRDHGLSVSAVLPALGS